LEHLYSNVSFVGRQESGIRIIYFDETERTKQEKDRSRHEIVKEKYKQEYIKWTQKKGQRKEYRIQKRKIEYYEDILQDLDMSATEVNPFIMENDILLEHDQEYGYVSTERLFFVLREFYRMLERKNKIKPSDNPMRRLEASDIIDRTTETDKALKKGEKTVSKEEVRMMAKEAPQPQIRNSVLIKLLYQTGIRAVEASKIKLDDIKWDKKRIKIDTAKRKGSTRPVFYGESISTELEYYIDVKREGFPAAKELDNLFLSATSNSKLSSNQISRVVKKAAYNIGINETIFTSSDGREYHRYTAHNLRYSFGRRLLENGENMENIRRAMGHRDISTTQGYLDVDDDTVDEMIRENIPDL